MIYLDWAATTPPDKEVLARGVEYATNTFGNPSSAHALGKIAKDTLESSRRDLIHAIFAEAETPTGKLVFTGSGTEASQIVLLGLLRARARFGRSGTGSEEAPHIIISGIEHSAVYEQAQVLSGLGFSVSLAMPDRDGFISAETVSRLITPSTRLVSVMAVNNETGAIQDTEAIGEAVYLRYGEGSGRRILFHVDCVQALGKIPLNLRKSRATSAAFSAHKLRGLKGTGALWTSVDIEPLCAGGGQESGMRSGTENLLGARIFAECARNAVSNLPEAISRARSLERKAIDGLRSIPGAQIVPDSRTPGDTRFSPWILSAAFPGLGGETLVRALSDSGIAVSTGSACSHGKSRKGRRILDAMNIPPDISFSAIRISTGPTTEPCEVYRFLEISADLYRRLKT